MSNYQKRMPKTNQKSRKKMQPLHMNKQNSQGFQQTMMDIGLYSNPQLIYNLARYMIGNVGEIHTSAETCIGVIRAVAPNGDFGLTCVRTSCDDGSYKICDQKIIEISDIKKIVLRNVDPSECKKEEPILSDTVPSITSERDPCLQHFNFQEDPEVCLLNSDDNFPPAAMFEVNKTCFNVTSSYQPSLEGYTLPLDKTDPEYKIKEEKFAKIAIDIENSANRWEDKEMGDSEHDEEVKFSAVFQEGVSGRDLRANFARGGRKGFRGAQRSIQRESLDVNRINDSAKIIQKFSPSHTSRTTVSNPNDGIFKQAKLTSASSQVESQFPVDTDINTKDEKILISTPTASSIISVPTDVSETSNKFSNSSPSVDSKDEKKKFTLDPNAPEFHPKGLEMFPAEPLVIPQQQSNSFPFMNTGFSQPLQYANFPVSTFVAAQPNMSNGSVNGAQTPFGNTSTYFLQPNLTALPPGIATMRSPQTAMYTPQQLSLISQQLSVAAPQHSLSGNNLSATSKNGSRSNLSNGNYSRQRSIDQNNQITQALPLPVYHQQNPNLVSFIPTGSHPQLGVQFLSPQIGLNSQAYGLPTTSNNVSLSPSCGLQMISNQQVTQPLQMSSAQQNQHSMASMQHLVPNSSQFHQFYQHPSGNVQLQSTPIAAYAAQYSNQLMGGHPSGVPNAIGFYPPSLFQSQGSVPFPLTQAQVAMNGQALNNPSCSQIHCQPTLGIQQTPIQAQQQCPTSLSMPQTQPTQTNLLLSNQQGQLNPQIIPNVLPFQFQAMVNSIIANSQAMQNTLNPQNINPQSHSMQLFLPQQSNGTG